MATFPPRGDLALKNWATPFSALITLQPTVYSLTASDATALANLLTDYSAKLTIATTPATRTKSSIAAKDQAKKSLAAKCASFSRIITSLPNLSDAQRIDLGLNPRDLPSPVPVPASAPLVSVTPDGVVTLKSEPTRRGKPQGVNGAVIFTKVQPAGQPAPATPAEAAFNMLVTRTRFPLPITEADDTKKLYVLAQWFNERGELGPVSNVAVTTIAA